MVSRSARLRVGLVASFVLGAASAEAQQPARGRVGYVTTVSYPSAFDGEGNTPQTRETFLRLGLFARAIGDDPLQVAMATSRIEVCTVEVGQIVTCPGTPGFVLYDDTATPAVSLLPGISTKEELAAAIRTADATGVSFAVSIPGADWGVPATINNNLVYFLRVNGEPVAFAPAPGGKKQLPAALRDGGWAGQPRRFGTPDARFFGLTAPIPSEAGDPFAGALACTAHPLDVHTAHLLQVPRWPFNGWAA